MGQVQGFQGYTSLEDSENVDDFLKRARRRAQTTRFLPRIQKRLLYSLVLHLQLKWNQGPMEKLLCHLLAMRLEL